jgi:hypothetical protein
MHINDSRLQELFRKNRVLCLVHVFSGADRGYVGIELETILTFSHIID